MDLSSIVAAILGGLAGSGLTLYSQQRQQKKEFRSLILSFASELVLAFERCVMYYEQSKKGVISYSGLFDFTDASIFSKFAAVADKPEIVTAIMELKSIYFQVGRHVIEAAKSAAQAEGMAEDEDEKKRLLQAARHAQGRALAFFLSSYGDAVSATSQIVEAAREISPGSVVNDLTSRVSRAKQRKINVDELGSAK